MFSNRTKAYRNGHVASRTWTWVTHTVRVHHLCYISLASHLPTIASVFAPHLVLPEIEQGIRVSFLRSPFWLCPKIEQETRVSFCADHLGFPFVNGCAYWNGKSLIAKLRQIESSALKLILQFASRMRLNVKAKCVPQEKLWKSMIFVKTCVPEASVFWNRTKAYCRLSICRSPLYVFCVLCMRDLCMKDIQYVVSQATVTVYNIW